jgi:uncharacterized protein YbcI
MVTDKAKVQTYLDAEAEKALHEYADKNRLTKSSAIEKLIKDSLGNGTCETPEAIVISSDYENRLTAFENNLKRFKSVQSCLVSAIERIDEQLAVSQDAIERLNRVAGKKSVEYFTDDEVAAYARVRVEAIREFRHGIRKPRGSNICSLLKDFVVENGRWRKRG